MGGEQRCRGRGDASKPNVRGDRGVRGTCELRRHHGGGTSEARVKSISWTTACHLSLGGNGASCLRIQVEQPSANWFFKWLRRQGCRKGDETAWLAGFFVPLKRLL